MADSYWRNVTPDEARRFEERFGNGDSPADDMRDEGDETKIVPPGTPANQPHVRIEMSTWSNVTCNPPPDLVLEECDKCDGHAHRVKILFGAIVGTPAGGIQGPGVADQQHVPDAHYGQHLGERFANSRCRGEEITRSVLTWSVSGRTITVWKRRTIDHVKNGFVWISDISATPCAERKEIGDLYDPDWLEGGEASQRKA